MNDKDFDLETFVDLFDTAMNSDNPTVKKAFKNLMLVVALVESENPNTIGPLRNMLERVKSLDSRVATLEWKTNTAGQNFGPVGGAAGLGSAWISTTTGPYQSAPNSTYTLTSTMGGVSNTGAASGTVSASTANYMVNSNYIHDSLFDNLESKN